MRAQYLGQWRTNSSLSSLAWQMKASCSIYTHPHCYCAQVFKWGRLASARNSLSSGIRVNCLVQAPSASGAYVSAEPQPPEALPVPPSQCVTCGLLRSNSHRDRHGRLRTVRFCSNESKRDRPSWSGTTNECKRQCSLPASRSVWRHR